MEIINDGIHYCKNKCKCGGVLRLHAYTFNAGSAKANQKYYVDCFDCKTTTDWFENKDDALEAFRKEK